MVEHDEGHDACGVGFIARVDGTASRGVVSLGLDALRRLAHRGAPAALGAVDGCGILTAIPWSLFAAEQPLPFARTRALAMLFAAESDADAAIALVERECRAAGALDVAWRHVPTDPSAVLPAQRSTTPIMLQAIVALEHGRKRAETVAYRTRLRIER